MKLRLLALIVIAALVAGCEFASRGSRRREAKPVTIYGEGEAPGGGSSEPSPELMDELKRQQEALAQSSAAEGGSADAEAAEAAPTTAELSVDNLIAELESKERTPAEDEAYKRLLGIAEVKRPPRGTADSYSLLGEARDAVLRGNLPSARDLAAKALAGLRSRTDPVIESVYFATEVRNYGNADRISPAEFTAGQLVLLVTELSSFACEPAGAGGPAEYFYTKMSQRVAIYGAQGKLIWQKSFESQEYQSAHSISTMFIPRKFNLPSNMAAGEYTAKVEIIDQISNRQTESDAKFNVK